jgi:hypothetical protein
LKNEQVLDFKDYSPIPSLLEIVRATALLFFATANKARAGEY